MIKILCIIRPWIVDVAAVSISFLEMPAHDTGDDSNMSSATTVPTEEPRLASSGEAVQTAEPWYVRMKQWIEGLPNGIKLDMMETYVASCDERVPLPRKGICVAALTYVIVTVRLDMFIFPEALSTERISFHSILGLLANLLTKRMIPRNVWKDAKQAVDAREARGNGGTQAWNILSVIWTIQFWGVF